MEDSESEQFADSCDEIIDISTNMESVLQPPPPFSFENNLVNVTSGNLSAEWDNWKKSFKIYYEACELSKKSKKVQVNILLHVIGNKCREVYEQFTEEDTDTVEGLLQKFDAFFVPVKNLAVERHKFFKRDQKELESTEQYIFELNKIASKCEFKELRDGLVCSRFICGVKDVILSERMLREPDISLKKAVDICKLSEMSKMQALNIKTNSAEHQVHEISENNDHSSTTTSDVHRVNRRRAPRRPPRTPMRSNAFNGARENQTHTTSSFSTPSTMDRSTFNRGTVSQATTSDRRRSFGCSNCGHAHRRMECPAFGARCNNCSLMNHYARMCRQPRRVYEIQEDSTDQDSATS